MNIVWALILSLHCAASSLTMKDTEDVAPAARELVQNFERWFRSQVDIDGTVTPTTLARLRQRLIRQIQAEPARAKRYLIPFGKVTTRSHVGTLAREMAQILAQPASDENRVRALRVWIDVYAAAASNAGDGWSWDGGEDALFANILRGSAALGLLPAYLFWDIIQNPLIAAGVGLSAGALTVPWVVVEAMRTNEWLKTGPMHSGTFERRFVAQGMLLEFELLVASDWLRMAPGEALAQDRIASNRSSNITAQLGLRSRFLDQACASLLATRLTAPRPNP